MIVRKYGNWPYKGPVHPPLRVDGTSSRGMDEKYKRIKVLGKGSFGKDYLSLSLYRSLSLSL